MIETLMLIIKSFVAGVVLWLYLDGPARAKEVFNGSVNAKVIDVYDGDTFTVQVYIWIDQYIITKVRLRGVDAPEYRAKCALEKELALASKKYLSDLVINKNVILMNIEYGKYSGRVIADVKIENNINLADEMLITKHARAYDGGKRMSWCNP
jgi:micrococcal nuclease